MPAPTRLVPQPIRCPPQIQLFNVPRTATPADLRRLIIRGRLRGVDMADIQYNRLEPTGRAFLRLTHPDFMQPNIDALKYVTLSGVHLHAEPNRRVPKKGTQLDGTGLGSELEGHGTSVVLWGFPKAVGWDVVDEVLHGQDFSFGCERYIEKLSINPAFTMCGRFLVRMASESEAHRLVRHLHMTYYKPAIHGNRYPLRARVIY